MNIEVGTPIIYKGDIANLPGHGVVFAARVKANPAKLYNVMAGMKPVDNSAEYDIVLDDGRSIRGIWPSNIGGDFGDGSCRFMLDPDYKYAAVDIPALLANAAAVDAMNKGLSGKSG